MSGLVLVPSWLSPGGHLDYVAACLVSALNFGHRIPQAGIQVRTYGRESDYPEGRPLDNVEAPHCWGLITKSMPWSVLVSDDAWRAPAGAEGVVGHEVLHLAQLLAWVPGDGDPEVMAKQLESDIGGLIWDGRNARNVLEGLFDRRCANADLWRDVREGGFARRAPTSWDASPVWPAPSNPPGRGEEGILVARPAGRASLPTPQATVTDDIYQVVASDGTVSRVRMKAKGRQRGSTQLVEVTRL